MLTLITLAMALTQTPPAPPEADIHSRVIVRGGPDGRGLDRDGDGQVTREEFAAPLNDAFGRLDKDNDGRLSSDELAASEGPDGDAHVMVLGGGHGGPGVHRFELRTDGDGPGTRRFEIHGDGDGPGEREMRIITRGEGEGPMIMRRSHGSGARAVIIEGDDLEGLAGGGVRVHRFGGPGGPGDLDKDGDGKVSEAEFLAPVREAFARMDADHSGYVEEGEHGTGGDVQVFTHRIERRDED